MCEVALGKINYINQYQKVIHLNPKFSSVKLRGKMELDTYREVTLDDGLKIPQGNLINVIDSYIPNLSYYVHNDSSEYTVYAPEQVKIRYVV